ncbi:MAG: hypothetical protein JJ916_14965 [Phycisphaerales bacterium]|nr:hypothetical protein [Phycisphaerales bacterium]
MTSEHPNEQVNPAIEDLYGILRAIAQKQMASERPDHTLEATAVVHEAYMRITDLNDSVYVDRNHFLSVAAETIRRVLVDHARAHNAQKRSGGRGAMTIHSGVVGSSAPLDVLELDDALRRLSEQDPSYTRLVELRFFGGLSIEEAADILGIGRNTAVRRWRAARAWLRQELGDVADEDGSDDA